MVRAPDQSAVRVLASQVSWAFDWTCFARLRDNTSLRLSVKRLEIKAKSR